MDEKLAKSEGKKKKSISTAQNLISDSNINSDFFSVFDFTILIMQVSSYSKCVQESSHVINCRKRLGKSPEKSLRRILQHIPVSVKLL